MAIAGVATITVLATTVAVVVRDKQSALYCSLALHPASPSHNEHVSFVYHKSRHKTEICASEHNLRSNFFQEFDTIEVGCCEKSRT
jgi:hypothetical protein